MPLFDDCARLLAEENRPAKRRPLLDSLSAFFRLVVLKKPAQTPDDWARVGRDAAQAVAAHSSERGVIDALRALVAQHGPGVAQAPLPSDPLAERRFLPIEKPLGVSPGDSLFSLCVVHDLHDTLDFLLPMADLGAVDAEGFTPLMRAIRHGRLALVRALLPVSPLPRSLDGFPGVFSAALPAWEESINQHQALSVALCFLFAMRECARRPAEEARPLLFDAFLCANRYAASDAFGAVGRTAAQAQLEERGIWEAFATLAPELVPFDRWIGLPQIEPDVAEHLREAWLPAWEARALREGMELADPAAVAESDRPAPRKARRV